MMTEITGQDIEYDLHCHDLENCYGRILEISFTIGKPQILKSER